MSSMIISLKKKKLTIMVIKKNLGNNVTIILFIPQQRFTLRFSLGKIAQNEDLIFGGQHE